MKEEKGENRKEGDELNTKAGSECQEGKAKHKKNNQRKIKKKGKA